MLILRTSKSKPACFQDHIRTPLVVSCPMVPDLAPDSTVPGRYGAHKFGGYCRVLPARQRSPGSSPFLPYCLTPVVLQYGTYLLGTQRFQYWHPLVCMGSGWGWSRAVSPGGYRRRHLAATQC